MNIFKSVFSGIAAAAKSTVAWLEKGLVAFTNAEPQLAHVVDAGLAYINPVLQIALASVGSDAGTKVADVILEAQHSLSAASALVTDFGPTPTAVTVFASVQKNLQALLDAGHVKSATSTAAVQKAINEVGLLGAAVGAAVTGFGAAAAPKP